MFPDTRIYYPKVRVSFISSSGQTTFTDMFAEDIDVQRYLDSNPFVCDNLLELFYDLKNQNLLESPIDNLFSVNFKIDGGSSTTIKFPHPFKIEEISNGK